MSDLAISLISAAFTAFFGVIGWIISTQIKTNKEFSQSLTRLSDALQELSKTIAVIEERDRSQKHTCQLYRQAIHEKIANMDKRITSSKYKNYGNNKEHSKQL
jgi:predicted PurR-regulated permease PerM